MRPFRAVAAAAIFVCLAGSAMAHAKLISAAPRAGGVVSGALTEIRINFSEGVLAKLSGIVVTSASGAKVPTGTPTTAKGDDKQLVTPLTGKLAAGTYTVAWHAVAADTHRTQGAYSFIVK